MKRLLLCLVSYTSCLSLLGGLPDSASAQMSPPAVSMHNPQAQAHREKAQTFIDHDDWNGAITEFQAAYALDKTAHLDDAAHDLNGMGGCSVSLRQFDTALQYFQQALPICQQVKDTEGQARALMNSGIATQGLSRYNAAIPDFQQALPLYRQANDRGGEADDLMNLGIVSLDLSQYNTAIQYYQQALVIYRQVKDIDGEAYDLNNLGLAYLDLNQFEKAVRYCKQALPIYQQLKDRNGEAGDLMTLGIACVDLHQYDTAIPFYLQALPIYLQIKDSAGQASALMNLGIADVDLRQYDKAIGYYQQALPIYRQVKDQNGEADVLSSLGLAYSHLNQHDEATHDCQQALAIFRQVKDRDGEAMDLNDLMQIWMDRANPRLAIFYGKQAINVYQSIRHDIQTMDKGIQKTYLKDKEPTYRELAELLIDQGRLPEAEQVLNMLKDEEFFDFVQRDATTAPQAGEAALTPVEITWQAHYQAIADKATTIGQIKQDLLAKQQQADAGEITLTTAQKDTLQKNLTQADAILIVANEVPDGASSEVSERQKQKVVCLNTLK